MRGARDVEKFVSQHVVDLRSGGLDQFRIEPDPVGLAGIVAPAFCQTADAKSRRVFLHKRRLAKLEPLGKVYPSLFSVPGIKQFLRVWPVMGAQAEDNQCSHQERTSRLLSRFAEEQPVITPQMPQISG